MPVYNIFWTYSQKTIDYVNNSSHNSLSEPENDIPFLIETFEIANLWRVSFSFNANI